MQSARHSAAAGSQPASAWPVSWPPRCRRCCRRSSRRRPGSRVSPLGMADSKLAPHATPLTVTPLEKIPARQAQGAGGLQGRALGARHARRAHDGARRQGHGLRRHARHRPRLRGHRQGRSSARSKVIAETCSSRTASPSRTARSTSSRSTRCCASTASRTSSTARSRPTCSDAFKLPPSTHHNWKFAAFGPDGKLYIADRRRPATSARSTPACTA